MKIRAVVFDIDGTLYPNRSMVLRSIPFFLFHMRFVGAFGKVRREIRNARPIDVFRKVQADFLARRMKMSSVSRSEQIIDRLIYTNWERTFRGIRPFPNLRTVLDGLKEEGYLLAVLSDFPVEAKLSYLGLEGYWNCSLCSEDTGYLKPNPEPFLQIAECLRVSPEEVLYVGNNYDYDIKGASQAGMRAALLSSREARYPEADFVFSSYSEFFPLFRDCLL
ncbi:MAG: HAD family hydrolase [Spirochaetales bacterium]|nr:HAD family hydrolase [Spirochaetales bacterium]MCF7938643.1 HAD family hydrolase [Spirochaetales bacterium]